MATGIKLTTRDFIERGRAVHGDLYCYDNSFYKNTETKVEVICDKHGSFWQNPQVHWRGSGCPDCSKLNPRMTFPVFLARARDVHGDRYEYDESTYKNNKSNLDVYCDKHGRFSQLAYCHLRGYGCKRCKESKGEAKIRLMLERNEINFVTEWADHGCVPNGRPMLFDFYLPDSRIVIEYDGEQHYKPIDFFGGLEYFLKIQHRDRIKDRYCAENGILMVRVRYDESIEDSVDSILQTINVNE